MQLTRSETVKTLLKEARFRPNKALGQNFLINEKVLNDLIKAANLGEEDVVIEPGAGLGTLTIPLARQVRKVYAYEIDASLAAALEKNVTREGLRNVRICNENILNFFNQFPRWSVGVGGKTGDYFKQIKVVGSIPYHLASPLIHRIIYRRGQVKLAVLLIQREVALKVTAQPPRAAYLSNFVGLYAWAKMIGGEIPPSAFWPSPKVKSAILQLKPKHQEIKIPPVEWEDFLHRGFRQPRKMLRNLFDVALLNQVGIAPSVRAQQLTRTQWQQLYKCSKQKSEYSQLR